MNNSLAFQVELFADLMVAIDDPFTERGAALGAAGLDEASYRDLVSGWKSRFDQDRGGALALRFADAYAARRAARIEARARAAPGDRPAADPRFLNEDALSFREEAAQVGREPLLDVAPAPITRMPVAAPAPVITLGAASEPRPHSLAAPGSNSAPPEPIAAPPARFRGTMDITEAVAAAVATLPFSAPSVPVAAEPAPVSAPRPHLPTGTMDISAAVPRDAAPFPISAPRAPPPAPPPPAPAPAASTGVARAPQQFTGTADVGSFVPRPATPFSAPPAEAAPAPRKRLVRFDPQTGQPLPAPIWVDLPPEPLGSKK